MNSGIFRSYDVRGIYGVDINEDIALGIGKALALRTEPESRIAVAHDVRGSSPGLAEALVAGLLSEGKDVTALGRLPLGGACFAAWQNGMELAYVTASHLPSEWNGVKFFHSSGIGYAESENAAIRDTFRVLSSAESPTAAVWTGGQKKVPEEDSIQDYIAYLLSKIKPAAGLRVVVDCGNGAGCLIAPPLFEKAGFEVERLFCEPDGRFPNRAPDPLEADLSALRNKVLEAGADLGIAYDGDGDRMALMDNTGRVLTPGQTSHFLLSYILQKYKGPVVANVECTSVIDDVARQFGCEIVRIPVGHTFLMEAVHRQRAAFGVETSGHYSIPSLVPFDDALAISYYAACILSSRKEKLSEIVSGIPVYPYERLSFPCPDERKFGIVEELKARLAGSYRDISAMDGIRIGMDDGWVLIRPSNTEPKIRLTIEARTPHGLARIKEEFTTILNNRLGN